MAASVAVAGYAFASGDGTAATRGVLGPGPVTVTLHVEHSRFKLPPLVNAASDVSSGDGRPGRPSPARVVVRQHTTVTFEVVNHDPIGHEFIVGGEEVHAIHEAGTHGVHGAVPGEVSVAPGETAATTYTFHTQGVVVFACHLPRHFSYGMVGEVVVKPPTN
ncbi:MAG: multicopper oxidase domain-containing protein [Acidimicrobiia bacterium]